MSVISEFFSRGWKFFVDQVKSIGFNDIIDILIVAVLFYYIYLFIRDRRAGKLAIGVAILVVMQIVSEALDLTVMKFILQNIFQIGVLAIIIIFQPELRSMLERVGGDSLRGLRNLGTERDVQQIKQFKDELCDAVNELSMSRTGALIAIERSTRLGDVIASGTIINADVSSLLLRNIFFDKSPLHDGAVVIRDMRILSAGCMLPLASKTNGINKELGTRHRAAIGLSEQSDAVIIVVSEETGNVSVAYKGRLTRDYDVVNLRLRLDELIYPQQNSRKRKSKKNGKTSGETVENVKEDADDVQ
ncbi:MAG: diadenylate cyclase CdaA [Clostridia bacterium]|nr:diadenylate cyclase CdaA [Clostridia bacterium]